MDCFRVGDNGIGLWGDDTTGEVPMCALPRGAWSGLGNAARGRRIVVEAAGKKVVCELRDTLPRKPKHGVVIDLNAAAVKALGLKVPLMVKARYSWEPEST